MKEDLTRSVQILRAGGIILYPTDTIWGIGCDATRSDSVERIYTIKNRSDKRTMLVLVDSIIMLERYVSKIPETAHMLLEATDQPLTIIYPEGRNLAPSLLGENQSIGIRIVRDDFCLQLIALFGKPLVSTSANISGEPPPSVFSEISDHIKKSIDYIVTWRQDEKNPGKASGIIQIEKDNSFKILRK